jgi:hypothetical protein
MKSNVQQYFSTGRTVTDDPAEGLEYIRKNISGPETVHDEVPDYY